MIQKSSSNAEAKSCLRTRAVGCRVTAASPSHFPKLCLFKEGFRVYLCCLRKVLKITCVYLMGITNVTPYVHFQLNLSTCHWPSINHWCSTHCHWLTLTYFVAGIRYRKHLVSPLSCEFLGVLIGCGLADLHWFSHRARSIRTPNLFFIASWFWTYNFIPLCPALAGSTVVGISGSFTIVRLSSMINQQSINIINHQ